MADDLRDILEQARRDCPDVPEHAWSKIELSIRTNFGASKLYIAAKKKSRLIAEVEAAEDATSDALAARLGCSVRRIQQLKKLSR